MLRKQKVVVAGLVVRPAGSLLVDCFDSLFLHVFKRCGFVWPDAFSVVVVDRFYIVVTLPAELSGTLNGPHTLSISKPIKRY